MDPEKAHHFGMFVIKAASKLRLTKLLPKIRTNKINSLGLEFDGAFGLAAGFDKNATAVKALGELGFSHIEIGTVTAIPQPGNPTPRLFRLIQDRALINRMGFNNDGAEAVSNRLEKLRASKSNLPIIGVNIGKSKVVELENAADDYRTSAKLLAPFADYLAVNVSSPNTPGLRDLQSVKSLKPILEAVLAESLGKPVLVKIAPDLADEDILAIAALSKQLGLAGVIATNTTIGRSGLHESATRIEEIGAGGLSGAPINSRSLEVLKLLRKELDSSSVIISVGGVETKEQVQERLKAGANLVQGYTGFVYFGPLWARKLNRI
ncbi:MAG: quinone-dependent dihydroorotate dehydrogenase [Micrococcales bacterium]|nr:quinone-dependent dihydroorotate dehydrogenase [Micrococcales bacterium]